MIETIFVLACIACMVFAVFLNIFSLPGNWLAFALACIWGFLSGSDAFSLPFLLVLAVIALTGEIAEFCLQAWGGKKYGGSAAGTIGGMLGAFAGAFAGAPLFFGLGAFPGALIGAFLGSLAVELMRGQPSKAALTAAWGAMLGRFGGTILKIACGFALVALAAPRILGWV